MYKVVVIGASAGGIEAISTVLSALPPNFPAAILIVQHIGARASELPIVFSRRCRLQVLHAEDGMRLSPSDVLVAPPDFHLTVAYEKGVVRTKLSKGPKVKFTRPAIDPLFSSAAAALREQVIGVLLTGFLNDGTHGLSAIKEYGGVTVVQEPAGAFAPSMPASALRDVQVDFRLPVDEIAPVLAKLVAARCRLLPTCA